MIGIIMDEVVPDKSSAEQEEQIAEVTEVVRGISQNRKRATRHKKVRRETVKNKGKTTVKSPEKSGRILIIKFIILYIIIVGS